MPYTTKVRYTIKEQLSMNNFKIDNLRTPISLIIVTFCFMACGASVESSFKEITGEDLPENHQTIFTEDSPTDVFGDYGRISVIKIDSELYSKLSNKLIQKGFKNENDGPNLSEFEKANSRINSTEIISKFSFDSNSVYYYVGFYNDKETIVIMRSSW
jgi:hypothetical protein